MLAGMRHSTVLGQQEALNCDLPTRWVKTDEEKSLLEERNEVLLK